MTFQVGMNISLQKQSNDSTFFAVRLWSMTKFRMVGKEWLSYERCMNTESATSDRKKSDAAGCILCESTTILWNEVCETTFRLCQAGQYVFCPMLMWLSGSSKWNSQGLCKGPGTWCGWNWCTIPHCTVYPCRVPTLLWCSIPDGAHRNWSKFL